MQDGASMYSCGSGLPRNKIVSIINFHYHHHHHLLYMLRLNICSARIIISRCIIVVSQPVFLSTCFTYNSLSQLFESVI